VVLPVQAGRQSKNDINLDDKVGQQRLTLLLRILGPSQIAQGANESQDGNLANAPTTFRLLYCRTPFIDALTLQFRYHVSAAAWAIGRTKGATRAVSLANYVRSMLNILLVPVQAYRVEYYVDNVTSCPWYRRQTSRVPLLKPPN
jgi:hypothetical protein